MTRNIPLLRRVDSATRWNSPLDQTEPVFDPVLLAPIIFVCHFLEESPTFVPWFNTHVARGITSGLFWRVNLTALVITLIVVAVEWSSRSSASMVLVIAWFGFLMFANAIFHIAGAFVDRRYVPGLVTAVLLYLPYYSWLFVRGRKDKRVSVPVMIAAAVIGGANARSRLSDSVSGEPVILNGETRAVAQL